jgi:YegS/Rv2252/BmrU family lipid kinase
VDTRKYFVIINPVAGHGRSNSLFPTVRNELTRRGLDFDYHYTNEPMEAPDVAKMVIEEGFTDLVAMGGDGTINEVVNGMMSVGSELPLAVIPAGSGNDFARMNGIPLHPMAAIDLLRDGRQAAIDLGNVGGDRFFVNGLGIGIDAQVASDVLKSVHSRGVAAYLLAAVRQCFLFTPFQVALAHGEWEKQVSCISLGVANGKYVGGGFKMAPAAETADGLLDVCVVENMPRLKRLLALPKARAGKHLQLREVVYRQVTSISISSESGLVAHLDGEPYRCPSSSFAVSVCPKALRVVVPQQGGSAGGS